MFQVNVSKIVRLFFGVGIFFCSAGSLLACQCYFQTVCQAYTQSKSVFVGKLEKIEDDTAGILEPDLVAYFSVEKTFKGTTEKLEKVKFDICDGEPQLKVGERYFVYKEDADVNNYCNTPRVLQKDDYNLKFAEGLSRSAPTYTVSGSIDGMSEEEAKLTEIWIEDGPNKYKVPV
jgi:hypothetical protein